MKRVSLFCGSSRRTNLRLQVDQSLREPPFLRPLQPCTRLYADITFLHACFSLNDQRVYIHSTKGLRHHIDCNCRNVRRIHRWLHQSALSLPSCYFAPRASCFLILVRLTDTCKRRDTSEDSSSSSSFIPILSRPVSLCLPLSLYLHLCVSCLSVSLFVTTTPGRQS